MANLQQAATVYRGTRQAARRRSRPKRKKTTRTVEHGRNDFLTYSFHPLITGDNAELLANIKGKEKSFFTSLSNLAALYDFTPLDVSRKVYPMNIVQSIRFAEKMVQQKEKDAYLYVIETPEQPACLATIKTYNTSNILFYIAIEPLLSLKKDNTKKQQVNLLLSICAYLYKIAGVPYYRDTNSYVYYQYDMIKEMTIEDESSYSKTEMKKMLREFADCDKQGDTFQDLISKAAHLQQFQKRLDKFKIGSELDMDIRRVASNAFHLYTNYPERTLWQTIGDGLTDPDEEGRVRPEQYVSFIWQNDGWMYESLCEYVNCDLQEYGAIDEPIAIQYFNSPQQTILLDLSFEDKFFTLMDDLAYIINNDL